MLRTWTGILTLTTMCKATVAEILLKIQTGMNLETMVFSVELAMIMMNTPLTMRIFLMIFLKATSMLLTMKTSLRISLNLMLMKIMSPKKMNSLMMCLNQLMMSGIKATGMTKIGMKVHLIFKSSQS